MTVVQALHKSCHIVADIGGHRFLSELLSQLSSKVALVARCKCLVLRVHALLMCFIMHKIFSTTTAYDCKAQSFYALFALCLRENHR